MSTIGVEASKVTLAMPIVLTPLICSCEAISYIPLTQRSPVIYTSA